MFFPTQMPWKLPISMTKVLWCIFQQCWGHFTMLLFEGSSETGLFGHLSNHVFGVRNFGKTKSMRVIFFSKCSKSNPDFRNSEQNSENVFFFFLRNCIWIGIVKLSLLRTGYFSLAANTLANSRRIWHITNRSFLQVNCLHIDQ